MMKRVDNAVYQAMSDGPGMEKGFNVMGVGNGGVGYAMDENNAELVSADMLAAVDEAAAKITDGSLARSRNSIQKCSSPMT